ncbi:hypothetical protein [Planococcus shixiaomingii]|uniref:hypothetical protein n=1 Tax=Planococcus shixiaomingii TaxID=3058393 RepID=UPI0026128397|nr:hypothetical protein [Planococcus sp. N022]WKA54983.1 hypothetical protein QWY21_00995 [Planococcus sp. N022]
MKKDKTRFKRLLRTRNSEFFQIDLADDDRTAFLLYVDCQDVEKPIDIYLITHFQVSDKSYEEILSFNNDMLSMKPTRHYYMKDLILEDREFEYDFPKGMDAIINFINQILRENIAL